MKTVTVEACKRMEPWRSTLALAADWCAIFALFFLWVLYPNPLTFIVVLLGVARFQQALVVLMHDAAHKRLYVSAWMNDVVAQVLCGSPLWFSLESYRYLHMQHHREPLGADDPDLTINGGYPIPWESYVRKTKRDLVGISYFKLLKYFHYPVPPARRSPYLLLRHFRLTNVAVNAALAGILLGLGHGEIYLLFWMLPMISVLQVALRLRAVAEHAGLKADADQRLSTRTMRSSWQTVLLAPHNVNFHLEHHLYPTVPFYHLPKIHRLLVSQNQLPEGSVGEDYLDLLGSLTHQE